MGAGPELDYDQLSLASNGLDRAGGDLDALGAEMPDGGGYGDAAPLISLLLGTEAEASATLVAEARWLAFAVGLCHRDMQLTDAEEALDIIRVGDS